MIDNHRLGPTGYQFYELYYADAKKIYKEHVKFHSWYYFVRRQGRQNPADNEVAADWGAFVPPEWYSETDWERANPLGFPIYRLAWDKKLLEDRPATAQSRCNPL